MITKEFPTIEKLSDRGRAFVGLAAGIAACLIGGDETSSPEFITLLVNSTKQVFKLTEVEANMAYQIGMLKGKDMRRQYQIVKKIAASKT